MAVTAFNTSTISEALDPDTSEFAVASTANISAARLTSGADLLLLGDELLKVLAVPASGRVKVLRGAQGTEARRHASGRRFFIIANPEDAKLNTKRQLALVGATNSGNYPDYLFPGQKARDGYGNEYVMCEFSAVHYIGTTVLINPYDNLFTAEPLAAGDKGAVGVLVEQVTSDQYAWVQVYGYFSAAVVGTSASSGISSITSDGVPVAPSSVSTPDHGLAWADPLTSYSSVLVATAFDYAIQNMFFVGAATSLACATSASSTASTVPVFLNYPFVTGVLHEIADDKTC